MKKYEEISISEMLELKSDEYVVIDIRDEIALLTAQLTEQLTFRKSA